MKRREFLALAGGAALAFGMRPFTLHAQQPLRFADMHAHLWIKQGENMRAFMASHGMLLVSEKLIPDSSFVRWSKERQTLAAYRDARPGEVRRSFDFQLGRALRRIKAQDLPMVTSVESLDRIGKDKVPGIVLASEGADFLEGDLGYLAEVRQRGVVHLQLLHYRLAEAGDISTEDPKYGGLSEFGKSVVRECNRLGILVDCAHGTSAGIDQMLDLSTRPVIYSHGHVSPAMPVTWQGATAARAIHAPLAKKLADKGGVLGLWPLWQSYPNLDTYSDELIRMTNAFGADHVGIGTDMDGLGRSTLPSYAEFAELPRYLAARGLNEAGIEGVLGGNYIRVLRQAISI
jgi:membrane dipeptidase